MVNARFAEMVGYSEEELMTRTPLDITHPEDLVESQRLVKEILGGTERCCVEKRYLRKDGQSIWARVLRVPIRDVSGKSHRLPSGPLHEWPERSRRGSGFRGGNGASPAELARHIARPLPELRKE